MVEFSLLERKIIDRLNAAKLGLRFDNVALRIISQLQESLSDLTAEGQCLIFTVTAPVKSPAKTAVELEATVRDSRAETELAFDIHSNRVHVLRISGLATHAPRALGFIHNPDVDAALVFAIVERELRGAI